MNKSEIRNLNNKFEIREVGEGSEKETHIQGYALIFNTVSEDLGGFKETIKSGALDNCNMDNVILNINHDSSFILARNNKNSGIGSLKLTIDEKGLFFDAIPTNTSYFRDLIANMEAGIIGKCSFRFALDWTDDKAQDWKWSSNENEYDFRTINKIAEINDVSIVVNPAYNDTLTTLYKRSKENYKNEKNNELEKEKMLIELELLK